MRLSCTTLVALASLSDGAHAFMASSFQSGIAAAKSTLRMVGDWDNDEFLDALSGRNSNAESESLEQLEEEPSQGGSRLKEIMNQASKEVQREIAPLAVENPFLAPQLPTANPGAMSVEEQARMFREMMQNGGLPQQVPPPPPTQRVARTDTAGRPVGRNRDADTIANTADLYFAQLKRDSTVRGVARIQGDDETAQKVFADEGVKELEGLLRTNPYLAGSSEKEESLFDTLPEEMLRPFFESDEVDEESMSTSGISYKEMLRKRRQKGSGHAPKPVKIQEPTVSVAATQSPSEPAKESSLGLSQATPKVAEDVQSAPSSLSPGFEVPSSVAPGTQPITTTPEESRTKIRTLMGLLLKHRGGPGFGKGRLQGSQIQQFRSLVDDVITLLRQESLSSATTADPNFALKAQSASSQPSAGPANLTQLDSMIACVEGAISMYKNSPPELKSPVMVTLRAALTTAIQTINSLMTVEADAPGASTEIDGTLIVIEGAVSMYKNSPPQLKDSVLVTLRAALMSAVATCDASLGGEQVNFSASSPTAYSEESQPLTLHEPLAEQALDSVPGTDRNTKRLEQIFENLHSSAGEGGLGLKSNLSAADASLLSSEISEMRGLLMSELESGIPDPDENVESEPGEGSNSTVSKYQQMLAKAKAEKGQD